MAQFSYQPRGVCSRQILMDISDDGIINEIEFIGGCGGNTQGVAALCKGMKVTEAAERLKGIDCGGRGTSCPDQLSKALLEALNSLK